MPPAMTHGTRRNVMQKKQPLGLPVSGGTALSRNGISDSVDSRTRFTVAMTCWSEIETENDSNLVGAHILKRHASMGHTH